MASIGPPALSGASCQAVPLYHSGYAISVHIAACAVVGLVAAMMPDYTGKDISLEYDDRHITASIIFFQEQGRRVVIPNWRLILIGSQITLA